MRRLIFLLLILVSCKPTEKSVSGRYLRYWDFENRTTLTLEQNKTFSLDAQEGLAFFQLTGTWAIDKRTLVLNSADESSKFPPSILVDKKTADRSGLFVVVTDGEGFLPGTSVEAFNETQRKEYSTNENGELSIQNTKCDSIRISFIGYKPLTIKVEIENEYHIRLNLAEPIGLEFENERWAIKGRRLIDPRFDKHKRKNVYRKR